MIIFTRVYKSQSVISRPILPFLFMLCMVNVSNSEAQETAMSPKIANYEMHIELDVPSKKLHGTTKLNWRNISEDPVRELHFHMYYNAFKNSNSTFFIERGLPDFLTKGIDDVCGWGWTHIIDLLDSEGNSHVDSMYYYQPDDDNIYDQTVLVIKLVNAVAPGEEAVFNYEWTAKIPKTMARTGYNKDYYFFAQWFPKVGVLEPAGMRFAQETSWNCHQYHSLGEYYSDFGDYDVYLEVPLDYEVASTGILMGQEKNDSSMVWHYSADDVIDFTWSCSPHFILQKDKYKDTDIYFYTYDYKGYMAERYFETIKFALAYLEDHIAPYPYRKLTIIDPPIHGMFSSGMEYPMLITSISFCFLPEGLRMPETLAVHELIHQYFMQLVATNETEEAWMDEGITSYYESRIMDTYLGANCSAVDLPFLKSGNKSFNRVEFMGMDHPKIASNAIFSWEYTEGGYGEIAYNKAALWLQTLEGLVGTEFMDRIMKTYFDRWKFKHPCRYDFVDLVNELVIDEMGDVFPEGMDWFFDQTLYGTGMCDYAVADIENEKLTPERGYLDSREECEVGEMPEDKYKSRIELHRLEELYFPQEIKIVFENGDEEIVYWDGEASAKTIEIETSSKVVAAYIDPERKIYIDKNFINNSLDLRNQSDTSRKIGNTLFSGIQSLLEIFGLLI